MCEADEGVSVMSLVTERTREREREREREGRRERETDVVQRKSNICNPSFYVILHPIVIVERKVYSLQTFINQFKFKMKEK